MTKLMRRSVTMHENNGGRGRFRSAYADDGGDGGDGEVEAMRRVCLEVKDGDGDEDEMERVAEWFDDVLG